MAVIVGDNVRVTITVGNEDITAVFPPYDDVSFQQNIKAFLAGRFRMRGGRKGGDDRRLHDARQKFFDTNAVDIEGVQYRAPGGEVADLNGQVENWKRKVPPHWKASFALYFEETGDLSEEEEGNSEPQSPALDD